MREDKWRSHESRHWRSAGRIWGPTDRRRYRLEHKLDLAYTYIRPDAKADLFMQLGRHGRLSARNLPDRINSQGQEVK